MRVKRTSKAARGFTSRLDGWQPGLAVVLVGFGAAVLVVPRPVAPREIPEPRVSGIELADLRAQEAQRAEAARAYLEPSVRAVGAAVRALGRAEGAGDHRSLAEARGLTNARIAAVAQEHGPQLLLLRAYQAEAFTAALRTWESGGEVTDDFVELGGNLVDAFRGAGWCVEREGKRAVVLSDDEIGVAFRKRWNVILRLEGPSAAQSLAEERLLFAVALRHPRAHAQLRGDVRGTSAASAQSLLRRIDEHAKIDPEYPAAFASGVVLFAAGQYVRSARAFEAHVTQRPDGPLTARAHNHLRAAFVAELGDDPTPSWFSF